MWLVLGGDCPPYQWCTAPLSAYTQPGFLRSSCCPPVSARYRAHHQGAYRCLDGVKEVTKQLPVRNPSAAVRRLLSSVAIQRPPFWFGLKTTNLTISSQRAVFCWLTFGTQKVVSVFSITVQTVCTLDGVKRGVRCTLLIRVFFYSIQEYTSWLMNRTFSCTASEGWIVRWAA